jgi:hypothetical protein
VCVFFTAEREGLGLELVVLAVEGDVLGEAEVDDLFRLV